MPSDSAWRSTIPFDTRRIGAVAIYCSDGRYNEQFDQFLHERIGLPRYDRLTIPGGAACLAGHFITWKLEEALAEQLDFLTTSHGLSNVVLIAHQSCGFYLKRLGVSENEIRARQEADLTKAAAKIRGISSHLSIEAHFAGIEDSRVTIEPVALGPVA